MKILRYLRIRILRITSVTRGASSVRQGEKERARKIRRGSRSTVVVPRDAPLILFLFVGLSSLSLSDRGETYLAITKTLTKTLIPRTRLATLNVKTIKKNFSPLPVF